MKELAVIYCIHCEKIKDRELIFSRPHLSFLVEKICVLSSKMDVSRALESVGHEFGIMAVPVLVPSLW